MRVSHVPRMLVAAVVVIMPIAVNRDLLGQAIAGSPVGRCFVRLQAYSLVMIGSVSLFVLQTSGFLIPRSLKHKCRLNLSV